MSFFGTDVTNQVLPCLKKGYLMCGSLFILGAFLIKKNLEYEDSSLSG